MDLYSTTELIIAIFVFVVGIAFLTGGLIVGSKFYSDITEACGFVLALIGAIASIVAGICLCITLICSASQRRAEPIAYQANLELRESLQKSIDNSSDIVNTDLYLRAIDFNSDIAKVQAAQDNPEYALSFSGKVDWNDIPLIILD